MYETPLEFGFCLLREDDFRLSPSRFGSVRNILRNFHWATLKNKNVHAHNQHQQCRQDDCRGDRRRALLFIIF